MSMDVGYTYCTRLTEEEIKLVNQTTAKNRIELIFVVVFIFSALRPSPVQASPLDGVDGFNNQAPIQRNRQNADRCRNHGIFSRLTTSKNTQLKDTELEANSPNRSEHYEASLNCTFERKQLQKKFKHAKAFGIEGNCNSKNIDLFQKKLIEHMKSTHACLGTYRGNDVYHYYDPKTKLNVMVSRSKDTFISGWRLSSQKRKNMEINGNIQ